MTAPKLHIKQPSPSQTRPSAAHLFESPVERYGRVLHRTVQNELLATPHGLAAQIDAFLDAYGAKIVGETPALAIGELQEDVAPLRDRTADIGMKMEAGRER